MNIHGNFKRQSWVVQGIILFFIFLLYKSYIYENDPKGCYSWLDLPNVVVEDFSGGVEDLWLEVASLLEDVKGCNFVFAVWLEDALPWE